MSKTFNTPNKVQRLEKYDKTGRYYRCPVCGFGEVRVDDNVFYGRCDECNATLIDYIPASHQEAFHLSKTTYRLLIGGFGSGKTTAVCAEDVIHCLTTPHARLLITAPTLQQVREAVLPELDKFIPPWFLEGGKSKGNPPAYDFINGSQIIVYASDDETKIRSLNLTAFHIEEASGVKHEIFNQLQTRLRNKAAVVRDEDGNEIGWNFMGNLSSNPEDTWIKENFLLKSKQLVGSQTVDVSIYENIMSEERVSMFETFISTSFDNEHLPPGTIERISAGKNDRWKQKYLYSKLDLKEGVVYPEIMKNLVEPFDIPDSWLRVGGYDPGLNDPTAALIGAIDPSTNIIYVYNEYYITDQPIGYHAKNFTPLWKPYNKLFPLMACKDVLKRSKESGVSYKRYFSQLTGIFLKPAENDILAGVTKTRNYIYEGKVKFFNNLTNLKMEAVKYAYAKGSDKPKDEYNHLMDSLRYMISPLPENPHSFKGVVLQQDVYKSRTVSNFKGLGATPSNPDKKQTTFVRSWR
jgi:PBSX family phage terminase large subunit